MRSATGPRRVAGRAARSVAAAPFGTWFAAGCDDRVVLHGADGQMRQRFRAPNTMSPLVVGPDGSWIAGGPCDRTIRWCETATGQVRAYRLTGKPSEMFTIFALGAAPDGSWLAVGAATWIAGACLDGTVLVWGRPGDLVATGTRAGGGIRAAALSRDGRLLATVDGGDEVEVWDMPLAVPGAVVRVAMDVEACCWLSDVELCLAGSDGLYLARVARS